MMIHGRCLCGAVAYQTEAPIVFSGNCYCQDCQRESGSGHVTFAAVPTSALEVTGTVAEYIKPVKDGRTVRQVFCPKCASTLFGCMSAQPDLALIRAGTLDSPGLVTPQANLFAGNAMSWDVPVSGLARFPGMATTA